MSEEIRYWKVAPWDKATYWEYCKEKGVIGIGWGDVGNLKNCEDIEELKEVYERERYDYPKRSININCKQIWDFYKNIKKGDVIVANNGKKMIVGIGVVTSDYYYDSEKIPETDLYHFRDVKWIYVADRDEGYDISGKIKQNWQKTVVLLEKDRELIEDVIKELGLNKKIKKSKSHPNLSNDLLITKKQIILYGPSGTGKTYRARKDATNFILGKDI